jgi:hypothetical protein
VHQGRRPSRLKASLLIVAHHDHGAFDLQAHWIGIKHGTPNASLRSHHALTDPHLPTDPSCRLDRRAELAHGVDQRLVHLGQVTRGLQRGHARGRNDGRGSSRVHLCGSMIHADCEAFQDRTPLTMLNPGVSEEEKKNIARACHSNRP